MKKYFLLLLFLPVICSAQTITPIANIQDSISVYDGQTVTIQGIVTIGAGVTHNIQLNVFIQDESNRGLMLYNSNITANHTQNLVRGNELLVTGVVTEYNNITELTSFTYQVLSTGNPEPTPVYIDLSQYLTGYEGTLVRAVGEISDRWSAGGGTNIIIEDQAGFSTTVRVWDSTGIDTADFGVGDILEAVGAGGLYQGSFQIMPGYQDHLREGEFVNYPYGDISELIPGFPVQITFSYPEDFTSVILFWKTNKNVNFEPVEMQPVGSREEVYFAEVPAQNAGTKVEFYLSTINTSNVETIFPFGYPASEAAFYYIIPVNETKAVLNVPPRAFNPYSGESFPIEFASQAGDKAIVRIYNAEGKLVFQPQNIIISQSSGNNLFHWNGKDKDGKLVPIGLYICYLEVINPASGNKKAAKAPIVVGVPLK